VLQKFWSLLLKLIVEIEGVFCDDNCACHEFMLRGVLCTGKRNT